MQEVTRYPNEMVQSSSTQYCGPTYPSLVLPFSRIHIKLGGCSTRPGKNLTIFALPAGVPLALAFSETLSKQTVELFDKEPSSKCVVEYCKALCVCLEGLCKVVARLSCPQMLKILLLRQMADILWTLCYIYQGDTIAEKLQLYSFPKEFLQNMRQELMKVFENETSKFPGKNKLSVFPPAGSVACGASGKFSKYFQAMLEFLLSAAKYQEQFHSVELLPVVVSSSTSLTVLPPNMLRSTSSEATSSDQASSATPPTVAELTKKPSKKARTRKSSKKDPTSESSTKKKKDWLSAVHSSAFLLRSVVLKQSTSSVNNEAYLSNQWKTKPTFRLLIVTGIDQHLKINDVQKGVQKLCSVYGGLYKDHLYLPTEEKSDDFESNKSDPEAESDATKTPRVEESKTSSKDDIDSDVKEVVAGCAVLELCCSSQVSPVSTALLSCPALKYEESSVQVCTVSDSLKCGDNRIADEALLNYLREKLIKEDSLSVQAKEALLEIFSSSKISEKDSLVSISQMCNNLQNFMNGYASEAGETAEELVGVVWSRHGNKDGLLSVDGFVDWVNERVRLVTGEGVKAVWLGLLACGYDLHLER